VHTTVLHAAAASLFGLSQRAEGGGVETSTCAAIRVSNCSTVTLTEVDCGPLLIGYRQHLSASDHILDALTHEILTRRRFS